MNRNIEYWSQKEIEYVTNNAYCKTYEELAKDLNRTKLSVERKMHRSGIKPLLWVHPEWTYDIVKYLKDNEGKKTYDEFAKELGKTKRSITKKMRKLGIKPKKHSKFKTVNDNFFKTWSEEMAYILGYWFADGHITSNSKRKYNSNFIFSITSKDKEILDRFSNIMQSTYNTTPHIKYVEDKKFVTYSIRIGSKNVYDDIIKLGGCERKSLVLKFPKVPDEYVRDFIRGYFDGDGSVRRNLQRNNYPKYPSINILGTHQFLSKLMEYLPYTTKIKEHRNIYQIDYHGEYAQYVLNYMYKDSTIYLQRKYDRYLDCIEWERKGKKPELLNNYYSNIKMMA